MYALNDVYCHGLTLRTHDSKRVEFDVLVTEPVAVLMLKVWIRSLDGASSAKLATCEITISAT